MDDKSKVDYWLEIANYDIETAEAMLAAHRFLYVGFMCHQAVEKYLKAWYSSIFNEVPPKTHSLTQLINKIGKNSIFSIEQIEVINKLNPLNIEARYPTYKDELLKVLTREYCIDIINETKSLISWIKSQL